MYQQSMFLAKVPIMNYVTVSGILGLVDSKVDNLVFNIFTIIKMFIMELQKLL